MGKNYNLSEMSCTILRKCRYVQLYVDSDKADQVMEDLKKERYVKKVLPCHLKDLDTDFVGSLQRLEIPSDGHSKVKKTQSFDGLRFFIDNCQIIRYILNVFILRFI